MCSSASSAPSTSTTCTPAGGRTARRSRRCAACITCSTRRLARRCDGTSSPPTPPTGSSDPSRAKSKRKAPSDDVLRALLDAADEDYACYLRLAAVTGARRGQLVALRWSDLDLTAGSVLFTRAHARVRGGVAEKTTKADVDYGLALDPETVEALRAHRRRCVERALATGASLPSTAYVFASPMAPDGSVAMFADGFDPVTVAGRGGWSSPTVPMKVYGHFAPARDQAAAACLAQRLSEVVAAPDQATPTAPARK